MKVINNTPFAVIALGYHLQVGFGYDVKILPGQSTEVYGPFLGIMGGEVCHITIPGEVICQEGPDDDTGYQIGLGNPIFLLEGDRGIIIRHHSDPMEAVALELRRLYDE